MDIPLEVTQAKSRLQASRAELDEAIQVSNVRGAQERIILNKVNEMVESVMGVERAWRVMSERSKYEMEIERAEKSRVSGRLMAAEAELADLRSSFNNLRQEHAHLERTYANTLREGEERVARLQESKNAELSSFKEQYSSSLTQYVQQKVSETRNLAVREQQTLTESVIGRIESEWRDHLDDSIAAVQMAQSSESASRREASDLRRALENAETRIAILEGELAGRSAELQRCRLDLSDHISGGRSLAEEVMRTRSMLELERSAHAEMLRLANTKFKHEVDTSAANTASNVQQANEVHRMEVERLRRVYDSAVQAREEALSEWRSKYAEAALRADKAEGLLREIDRQLVPAVGAVGAAMVHNRAASAAGFGPGVATHGPYATSTSRSPTRPVSLPAAGTGTGVSNGRLGLTGMSGTTRQSPLRG